MAIAKRTESTVNVLTLSGRLDLASGTELKQLVGELQRTTSNRSFHLNLTNVEFINSSGIGALVSVLKNVRLAKGRLTLSNIASYVREIFEITQLVHVFEIFPTEEAALKAHVLP